MIKDKTIISIFGGSVFVLVLSAVVGLITIPSGVGTLIIRFSTTNESPNFLGGQGTFFGLIGVLAFILILNFILALEVFQKDNYLSRMLASSSLVITFIFFIATLTIASIN